MVWHFKTTIIKVLCNIINIFSVTVCMLVWKLSNKVSESTPARFLRVTLIYFPGVSGQNTGQWFNWSCAPPINSTFTSLSLDWRRRKPLRTQLWADFHYLPEMNGRHGLMLFQKSYFRKNKNRLVKTSIPRETEIWTHGL